MVYAFCTFPWKFYACSVKNRNRKGGYWMILEELFSVRHTKIQDVGIHDSRARSNVFMEKYELPREKNNKVSVRPAKTQINLGIRPVWSESSLSAWRKLGPLATHWAHSEDSDQTGWTPRLIWVFTGRTATLLVLSRGGSYVRLSQNFQIPTSPVSLSKYATSSACTL